jgi:glycosyltransferase involved in cell wall biosynthesis
MSKPVVLFTRPAYWACLKSDKLELVHAPLSPGERTMLRNKKPCFESVGGVLTNKGADNLLKEFAERKPDVFLFWATYMQDGSKDRLGKLVQVLRECRRVSPKTLFLYGNGNQQGFPDFNVKSFMHFVDGILVNTRDKRERKMYVSHGIKIVETLHTFGFDPAKHGKAAYGDKTPRYDCFFGGSQTADLKSGRPVKFYPQNPMLGGKYANSKSRLDFIRAVDEKFKLLVRGKGKWPVKKLVPYAYGEDYPRAFGDAKIALNMYHWDLQQYYTKRTVYSGASGRLLVCKYIPGMENDFTNGENVVWFMDVGEALERIQYYLDHDKERDRVSQNQREHFVKNHSWEARLREFEGIVEKVL